MRPPIRSSIITKRRVDCGDLLPDTTFFAPKPRWDIHSLFVSFAPNTPLKVEFQTRCQHLAYGMVEPPVKHAGIKHDGHCVVSHCGYHCRYRIRFRSSLEIAQKVSLDSFPDKPTILVGCLIKYWSSCTFLAF